MSLCLLQSHDGILLSFLLCTFIVMQALVSEIEHHEEIMSPHHEPEALLHDFDLDTTAPDHLESTKSTERMDNEEQEAQKQQPYTSVLMTEENLKNHQNNEVCIHRIDRLPGMAHIGLNSAI